MVVIRAFQLVLDDYGAAGLVLCDEIDAERTSGLLAVGAHETDPNSVVDDIDVFFQPGCQMVRLMPPDLPKRNAFDLPNPRRRSSARSRLRVQFRKPIDG